MKGEKTLASGNVARWEWVAGLTKDGLQAEFRVPPSDSDLAEIAAFASSMAGRVPDSIFTGVGDQGKRAAKAAFETHLGRSSN